MILVLGGTTEGRLAVKTLDESGKAYFYSTRGALQQVCCRNGQRVTGAWTRKRWKRFAAPEAYV